MAEDRFSGAVRSPRYSTKRALGFKGGGTSAGGNLQAPTQLEVEGARPRTKPTAPVDTDPTIGSPTQPGIAQFSANVPKPPSLAQSAATVAGVSAVAEGAKYGVKKGVEAAKPLVNQGLDAAKSAMGIVPDSLTGPATGTIQAAGLQDSGAVTAAAPGQYAGIEQTAIPADVTDGVGDVPDFGGEADFADFADSADAGAAGADAAAGAGDVAAAGSAIPWIGGAVHLAQGDPRAAAGSVVGGTLGSYFGPVGTAVGSYLGGKVAGPVANEIWDFHEGIGGENFSRVMDPFASLTETNDYGQNIENTLKAPIGLAHDVNDSIGNHVDEFGQDFGNSVGGDVGNFVGDTISSIGKAAGGCFITEAVMAAGGQGDSAPELEILRWFRDNVMLANPVGQQMVQQYYVMAPLVVQAVSQRPDAMQIFASIKSNYLDAAVQAIQAQDHPRALQIYAEMLSFVTPYAIEAVTGQGGDAADRPADGQEQLDDFGSQAAMAAHSPELAGAATGQAGMGGQPNMAGGGPQPQPMAPGAPMANSPLAPPVQPPSPPAMPMGPQPGGGAPAISQFGRPPMPPQQQPQVRRY